MPIEIKELHIRVTIDPAAARPAASGPVAPKAGGAADKDAIVAECVEQVMQILQDRKER